MFNSSIPLRIGVVLFPALTALDIFGPLNALNYLSIKHPMTLSLLSHDMEAVSIDRTIVGGVAQGMLASSASPYFSEFVRPTHAFADAPALDVVLVPGGPGTRNLDATRPHVDWLRARAAPDRLAYLLTVCTGTSLVARAGTIAGRNATTNKAAYSWVTAVEHADEVNWVPKARWVVDGNLWTSSGVSAGTDMTLAWIGHLYGADEQERVRVNMEWVSLNQTDDPFAEIWGVA